MVKEILLSHNKIALIDDEDYELVTQYNWYTHIQPNKRCIYARRTQRPSILLHRFILNAPCNIKVDHQDHDGLNCQKYNLRLANDVESARYIRKRKCLTSSQFKGVDYHQQKWRARISVEKKSKHLGSFDTEIEAAKVYDEAAKIYFGEFAHLNFGDFDGS